MTRVKISPENQIERIKRIENRAKEIALIDVNKLTQRPSEASWSAIEVVEHMVLGHQAYIEKIDQALRTINDRNETIDSIKARAIPSFLIKRFPPKEGKIRFKMKTMKPFVPVLKLDEQNEEKALLVFDRFYKSLGHLLSSIEDYRKKEATSYKFNSAVGAWVKFNVAEAVEFILCHNERHMQQLENTLKKVG